MTVSPFTPLRFKSHKTDGIESDYIQTFSTTDRILLEILSSPGLPPHVTVYDEGNGKLLYNALMSSWMVNPKRTLWFTEMSLAPGYYSVNITGYGRSEVFRVTDNERELANTTLIQYSMKDNRQREDTVFWIDDMQYFFEFRVPGGFKDSSWSFGVESEQFVTPLGDIAQLSGLATTMKKFTMGGCQGVPVWFGQLLNLLLTCTHVYFDGIRYTRKESSVPEMTQPNEGVNSFIFSQLLQQNLNNDPTFSLSRQAVLRQVGEDYRLAQTDLNRLIY